VGREIAERLRAQVRADSMFLADNGIIDYSFLLGIHYSDRAMPEDIWINENKERLMELYQRFHGMKSDFFSKDFDFDRFAHYAYIHQHFEKKGSRERAETTDSPTPTPVGQVWNPRRGIRAIPDNPDEPEMVSACEKHSGSGAVHS
jgi:hypothetical protein